MDNQQGRLLSKDLMAGLIIGEGWFGFEVLNRKPRPVVRPGFAITMNDLPTMGAFIKTAKALDLPVWVQEVPNRDGIRHRPGVRVQIYGIKRMKRWLDCFLPYLYGDKKAAAGIVSEYVESRLAKPVAAPLTEVEIALVHRSRKFNGNSGRRRNDISWLKPSNLYTRKREAEPSETTRRAPASDRVKI